MNWRILGTFWTQFGEEEVFNRSVALLGVSQDNSVLLTELIMKIDQSGHIILLTYLTKPNYLVGIGDLFERDGMMDKNNIHQLYLF